MEWGYVPEQSLGYAQTTLSTSAVQVSSLTFGQAGGPGYPTNTRLLMIQPEKQGVRWRDDGIAPTTTVGYPIPVGAEFRYTGTAAGLSNLQIIGQATGAVVNVTAYGA